MRWMRLTVPVGFLLACVLLAGLPAAASAATPEMRGEWELAVFIESTGNHLTAKSRITQEANAKGEFAGSGFLFQGVDPGTFSGTLKGSEASVRVVLAPIGPFPEAVLTSETMKVETIAGLLTISGSVTVTAGGGSPSSGTVVATRLKSNKQIEEQEAKEKQEREARAAVRGEWAITLEGGPQALKGTALITEEATSINAFASNGALFESIIPGTFSGTLENNEAAVTITTQAAGPIPEGMFAATKIAVAMTSNSMSMTGPGTLTFGPAKVPGTLTATRIKTYQEVIERETAKREAKEKQEKEAEAKEKQEKEAEAKKKQEKEASEAAERGVREQKEKELKEREAREAVAKTVRGSTTTDTGNPLVPVELAAKTLTLGHGGAISLNLTNPGGSPVHGHLKLALAKTGKVSRAQHTTGGSKSSTLGEASFSIAGHGTEAVKVQLSKSGRALLARHKTLHVLVTITMQASGHPDITNSYTITLRAPSSGHHKG